jgi:menaquinone-specific isochorismate synthase
VKETQILQYWSKIKKECIDLINNLPSDQSEENVIYRAMIPIDTFPLFDFISVLEENGTPYFYWHERGNKKEILAFVPLMTIESDSLGHFEQEVSRFYRQWNCRSTEISFLGGMRFNGYTTFQSSWDGWPRVFFMLPQFEFIQNEGQCYFAVNYTVQSKILLVERFRQLFDSGSGLPDFQPLPLVHRREDVPSLITWKENIRKAVRNFDPNGLVKVVLARETVFHFQQTVPVFSLLHELQHHNTNSTYHFVFSPEGKDTFAGLTPERLYVREKNLLRSEAVAGTRRRGKSKAEDLTLEEDLLSSNKDRFEHKLVMDSIENQFYFLCEEIRKDNQVSVIKLDHLQHLYCTFEGYLKKNIRDPQILKALHPTPAVGGYPKDTALHYIAQNEVFDRGWYAAPIGWFNRHAAEFAVAIRSALIKEKSIHVFAGAGIVQGSDPQKEWDEIEDKITIFKQIFTV